MKRAKASEELVLDIKRTILSGKYPPGSKLPSEREFAQKYNLSRIPVREAIDQLVKENIVRVEPYIGTFVTDLYDVELLSKNMYTTSHIGSKLLKDSLATRQLIESECAFLAAKNATPDDITKIQEHLFRSIDEFRKLTQKQQNTFFKEDYAFHCSIAEASHNDVFIQYMALLADTITIHQFSSMQMDESIHIVPDSHFRIYNAILVKDAALAKKEMSEHMRRTADMIL